MDIASSVCTPVDVTGRFGEMAPTEFWMTDDGCWEKSRSAEDNMLLTDGSIMGKLTVAAIPRFSATVADVDTILSVLCNEFTEAEYDNACANDCRSAGVKLVNGKGDDGSETGMLGTINSGEDATMFGAASFVRICCPAKAEGIPANGGLLIELGCTTDGGGLIIEQLTPRLHV